MQAQVIFLLVGVLAACLSALCPKIYAPKSFHVLPALNNVIVSQDAMAEASEHSEIDCGRHCVDIEGCAMFTFHPGGNNSLGSCSLFGQLPDPTDSLQTSLGARSYVGLPGGLFPDNGYTLRCGRCLRFVPTLMLYDQAKQLCAQLDNGHLPVVKTLEELLCVRDFTTENAGENMWTHLAVDSLADQQTYVWFDGTAVASDSPLWGRSQPDQRPGEFCVGIRGTDGGMHDLYCESYNGYPVCQKDL